MVKLIGIGVLPKKELEYCPICKCATIINGVCLKKSCQEKMLRDGN